MHALTPHHQNASTHKSMHAKHNLFLLCTTFACIILFTTACSDEAFENCMVQQQSAVFAPPWTVCSLWEKAYEVRIKCAEIMDCCFTIQRENIYYDLPNPSGKDSYNTRECKTLYSNIGLCDSRNYKPTPQTTTPSPTGPTLTASANYKHGTPSMLSTYALVLTSLVVVNILSRVF